MGDLGVQIATSFWCAFAVTTPDWILCWLIDGTRGGSHQKFDQSIYSWKPSLSLRRDRYELAATSHLLCAGATIYVSDFRMRIVAHGWKQQPIDRQLKHLPVSKGGRGMSAFQLHDDPSQGSHSQSKHSSHHSQPCCLLQPLHL